MKGLIVCLVTLLLVSCYRNTDVVEYKSVTVAPVVTRTPVVVMAPVVTTPVVRARVVTTPVVARSTVSACNTCAQPVNTCELNTCGKSYVNNAFGSRSNYYDYDYDYYDTPNVTTTNTVYR